MSRIDLTRRALLIGSAAFVAARPRLARAEGKKILLVGDSMIATAFGQRIEYGLGKEGFSVHRRGKSSSGLARPDFFDWPGEARKLAKRHAPDGTVVMMGGNDAQSLRLDQGWIKWGEAGWRGEYLSRIHELLEILSPDGQPLGWVGLPIVRSPSYRRKVETINALVEEAVDARAGASFISTWDVLAQGGKYADSMTVGGKEQAVRGSDGVHLTMAGARLLEQNVRPKLVEALSARVG